MSDTGKLSTNQVFNTSRVRCPKCGGGVGTMQVENVLGKYCAHCGPLPVGTNVKTGKAVRVGR